MNELLAHLVGDYIFQNDWMAVNKTKKWLPALIHAALYTLSFTLLTQNLIALAIIFGTHLLIDRFRLAVYWIKLVNNNWHTQFGYDADKPIWMSVWLVIIIDNVWHLVINHFALMIH